jgi:aryl sulfotransferase
VTLVREPPRRGHRVREAQELLHSYARLVPHVPTSYRSPEEDSSRWLDFAFRSGDIIISARSKSGTTWMQTICALLVFQTPDLPAPLSQLSPWLDWLITPAADVYALLEAQEHRRFIKTHTPLDGVPLTPKATYIVVARHPLDMAVSLYHQGANLDRDRIRELTGKARPARRASPRLPLREWLLEWIHEPAEPQTQLDSLPGVLWHLRDAWSRRTQPNILLVHFQDLVGNLRAEMRRLADRLEIGVPDEAWPRLVEAARFTAMQARADLLAPDPAGVLKDRRAFFRRGTTGNGRELLSDQEYADYLCRAATLAPPDLLAWLHRDVSPVHPAAESS